MKLLATWCFLFLVIVYSFSLLADDTNSQTNTSGSNTNITGGYTTTNNNTYQSGSSNDTTSTTNNDTTNTTNNKSTIPVNSANAPSFSSMSQDVCSMAVSGSVSSSLVGVSGGKHYADLNCERIKLAKVLKDFGMSVASVSILCQDARVFSAMESAGTPCPFQGKIGNDAKNLWKKYPELRPDYEEYIEREEYMASIRIEEMCKDCNDPFKPIIIKDRD